MNKHVAGIHNANYSLAAPHARPVPSAEPVARKPVVLAPAQRPSETGPAEIVHAIDDFDLGRFLTEAANFGDSRFGYVVTPNVDHLVRYHEDAEFRALYRDATYVLMDSRFCARVLRLLKGVRLPVCTGSDLSERLLSSIVAPSDRIVILGGSAEQVEKLSAIYGLRNVRHHNPPMGFISDPIAVEECLQFIEREGPFRFCFLAVGSPQQEMIAHYLHARGVARGLALCVGASLNFVTGVEKRAPGWMQRLSLEWLHRLIQNPRRMARRYLVRGPRIFRYLPRARFVLRKATLKSV